MTPETLKAWRQSNDLKQYEFAEMLGVTAVTVCRWENGARAIPGWLEHVIKLRDEKKALIAAASRQKEEQP